MRQLPGALRVVHRPVEVGGPGQGLHAVDRLRPLGGRCVGGTGRQRPDPLRPDRAEDHQCQGQVRQEEVAPAGAGLRRLVGGHDPVRLRPDQPRHHHGLPHEPARRLAL